MSSQHDDSRQVRRATHVDHDVVYAEVGASADPHLQRFPPEGATPYAEELQLGSGSDRFVTASSLLMTWGAQRGAGMQIIDIETGDGGQYDGVAFDKHGTPQPVQATHEDRFAPNGVPFLTAGTTLRAVWTESKRPDRLYRVVYIIDETRRIGFAWGTADDAGTVGEEVFAVEHRDDDTVWATVSGFVRASETGLLGVKGRASVKRAVADLQAQLQALAPGGVQLDLDQ